uniref:Craniofacial development protein 1 n=1 Tax=Vombatus ursinus TaxID=29139 RepID=A0A4X2M9A8_VOMUR
MDDYDSEDFSSSEEDEDYVPSGGEYSEDDVSELVKEDEVQDEEETQKDKGKKRNSKDSKKKSPGVIPRKRKKGGLLMEDKEETEDKVESETEENSGEEEEKEKSGEPEKSIPSEEERKRQDDALWASFLSDVGPRSQARPPGSQAKTEGEGQEKSANKSLVTAKESEKPSEREKVKITKVFDFAGEEVRVTKEVDVASKEAKSFFKQNEKEKPRTGVASASLALPTGSGNLLRLPKFHSPTRNSSGRNHLNDGGNSEPARFSSTLLSPHGAPALPRTTCPVCVFRNVAFLKVRESLGHHPLFVGKVTSTGSLNEHYFPSLGQQPDYLAVQKIPLFGVVWGRTV